MRRKTFSFFTGGKDSTAAFLMACREGYNPDTLVTIHPANRESYMFHSINLWITTLQSMMLGRRQILYEVGGVKEAEVEELKPLVKHLYDEGYTHATVGGLLSNYQKRRFEKLLSEYGIELYSPFWGVPQDEILHSYIDLGINFMLTSVSSMGLSREHLGWILKTHEDVDRLVELGRRYGFNPTGEGGEYESLVVYIEGLPLSIRPRESRVVWDGVSGFLEILDVELAPPTWLEPVKVVDRG